VEAPLPWRSRQTTIAVSTAHASASAATTGFAQQARSRIPRQRVAVHVEGDEHLGLGAGSRLEVARTCVFTMRLSM
jgi:hypothetical protein